MITFLILLDIFFCIAIIASIFLHNGPDGFMGEATVRSSSGKGIKFEFIDKVIGLFVAGFFLTTISINYLTLYKEKGTAKIDDIIQEKKEKEKQAHLEEKKDKVGAVQEAPILD